MAGPGSPAVKTVCTGHLRKIGTSATEVSSGPHATHAGPGVVGAQGDGGTGLPASTSVY